MNDLLDISRRGFYQKLGAYLVMTLLVSFTVAGFLTVDSFWKDAATVTTAAVEPLDFPYLKATTLFAYWSNPPVSPSDEVPPPRKYAPVFNDEHLQEIGRIRGVLDLSVALEQTAFSRFGNSALISIEPGAQLWQSLELVFGRMPENSSEVILPEHFVNRSDAPAEGSPRSAQVGDTITVKVVEAAMPAGYRIDWTLRFTPDPEPEKRLTVVGVYRPLSMIDGLVGYLPVNRVHSYPEPDPKEIKMSWPVPNTIYLHLADPQASKAVASSWFGMYLDYPGAEPPLIPPAKVEWHPTAPEDMIRAAASQVATPLFVNTFNAFLLGAIGIFAAMFVSFLDRRKELGIMKTVGIDNNHTAGAVSLEVVFAGALGTVLGILGAQAVACFLKGVSGNPIRIPAASTLMGAVVSASILAAATYVPRAMAKQGTVMELLNNRPIPIVRSRR